MGCGDGPFGGASTTIGDCKVDQRFSSWEAKERKAADRSLLVVAGEYRRGRLSVGRAAGTAGPLRGVWLTGEDGLLQDLAKVVVEAALDGEMDDHLGYPKHDPAGTAGTYRRANPAGGLLTEAGRWTSR